MGISNQNIIESYSKAASGIESERVSDAEAKARFKELLKKSDIKEVYKRLRDK